MYVKLLVVHSIPRARTSNTCDRRRRPPGIVRLPTRGRRAAPPGVIARVRGGNVVDVTSTTKEGGRCHIDHVEAGARDGPGERGGVSGVASGREQRDQAGEGDGIE